MGPLLYNVKDRIKEARWRYEEGRTMTYSEFRDSFTSAEEFRQAFGKLSQDEAYALVSTIEGSPAVKGCAIETWREASKEFQEKKPSIH